MHWSFTGHDCQLFKQLTALEQQPHIEAGEEEACCIRSAIQVALRQEETLWESKSRVQWLATINLNMRFFRTSTIIRQ